MLAVNQPIVAVIAFASCQLTVNQPIVAVTAFASCQLAVNQPIVAVIAFTSCQLAVPPHRLIMSYPGPRENHILFI